MAPDRRAWSRRAEAVGDSVAATDNSDPEEVNRPFDPVAELEQKGLDGERAQTLRALVALYAQHNLMPFDGVFPTRIAWPLWCACSNGQRCWAGWEARQTPNRWLHGISLPWIGSRYAESRVAVVGLNQRGGGGPLVQWDIAEEASKRLKAGADRPYRSAFWKGVAQYVVVALRHLQPSTHVSPRDALEHAALLQLVKCSPTGDRGAPNRIMAELCPPKYLRDELEILAPEIVLVCTKQHGSIIARALQSPPLQPRGTASLGETVASIAGRSAPIIHLRHPADQQRNSEGQRGVERSLSALARYLNVSEVT